MSKRALGMSLLLMLWSCWLAGGTAHAQPQIVVAPASPIDFGAVRVSNAVTQSATQDISISNVGTQVVVISAAILTNNTDYSLEEIDETSIPPGDAGVITVVFNPTTAGTKTSVLNISSNAGAVSRQLTGIGTQARIRVTDAAFGMVNPFTISTRNVIVSNDAIAPRGALRVTSATITGSSFFVFGSGLGCNGGFSCTFNPPLVLGDNSASVPVSCAPSSTMESLTATLRFSSDSDDGSTTDARLTCTGGPAGELEVLPTAQLPATFRNPGDAAPVQTVTVRNSGQATLVVSASVISGAPVWQLLDQSPVELAVGAAHDFLVRFSPTQVGPAPDGQLEITANGGRLQAYTVVLSGTATSRNVVFGPQGSQIEVADAVAGTQSTTRALVIINRDTTTSFTVRDIVFEGSDVFTALDARDSVVESGQSTLISVAFAPRAEGEYRATALLYLDQDPEPHAELEIVGVARSVHIHGGGCETTGAGHGSIALLIAVLWRLRLAARRRVLVLLVVAAVWTTGRNSLADDVVIGVFDPAPAIRSRGFQLADPEVGPAGTWATRAVASYATNLLVFDTTNRGVRTSSLALRRRGMLALGAVYAFGNRFEAGARLPMYAQSSDPAYAPSPDSRGTALGDATLHVKAQLTRFRTATFGAAAHTTLPTATEGQFTGVDAPTLRLEALAAWRPIPKLAFSAVGGGVLRRTSVYREMVTLSQGSGLVWGVGASGQVTGELFATAELFGELTRSENEVDTNVTAFSPVEAMAGFTYRFPRVSIGIAVGRGIGSGIGAPSVRGSLLLSYTSDPAPRPTRPAAATEGTTTIVPEVPPAPPVAPIAPTPPTRADSLKAAETTFEQGRKLLAQRKYREACESFEHSQRLDPQLGTQYNLAGCYERLGKLATAWKLYLDLGRTDSNPARRAKSAQLAAELAPRVPKLALVLSKHVAGVEVTIDDANATALLGVGAPIDLGKHTIVARAAGYRIWRKVVDIRKEGAIVTEVIELQPSP